MPHTEPENPVHRKSLAEADLIEAEVRTEYEGWKDRVIEHLKLEPETAEFVVQLLETAYNFGANSILKRELRRIEVVDKMLRSRIRQGGLP